MAWFVMENVRDALLPAVRGYQVHAQLLNNRWFGGVQNRVRRISCGTHDGHRLNLPGEVLEPAEWAPAVCASGGVKPGVDLRRSPRANELGYKTRAAFEDIRRLQGLPDGFELPNFTVAGAIEAVGNEVPLPLGRAIAKAVWLAMSEVGEMCHEGKYQHDAIALDSLAAMFSASRWSTVLWRGWLQDCIRVPCVASASYCPGWGEDMV